MRELWMPQAAFAKFLGVAASTVTEWKQAGMPGCEGAGRAGRHGRIDAVLAVPWIIARRDSRPDSQRERLARAQATRVELENRVRTRELIERVDVEEGNNQAAALFVSQLEGVPGRVATELAAIRDPGLVRERLRFEMTRVRRAIYEKLTALASPAKQRRRPAGNGAS
jgi:phage terminase Nu1 subunit (DNA packaging protein)